MEGRPRQAPRVPGAPSNGAPSTPLGSGIADHSEWSWWWNFNRDPYLELKRHVLSGQVLTGSDDYFLGHGQRSEQGSRLPDREAIQTRIGPALQKAVVSGSWRVQSDAMMAIAKLPSRVRAGGAIACWS